MPTVPLPITPVYRNVDGVELRDNAHRIVDGYINELGAVVKRPGLVDFLDLGAGSGAVIDGLYWSEPLQCVIAVSDGKAWKVTYPNQVATKASLFGAVRLAAGVRASFASDGTYVFIATGEKVGYTNGTANVAVIADANCPTVVNSVAFLDTYILVNNAGTAKFHWSDLVGGSLSWSASSFASAMGNADAVTALHVRNREIFLFGPSSVEFWENDGVTPFSRVPGGYIDWGCIAPKSIMITDTKIFWLDDKRRFVEMQGGNIRRISTPYDREVQSFTNVSDCIGDYVEIGGKQFLIWQFPAEQKTLVCNITVPDKFSWTEWGNWQSGAADYHRFLGHVFCFCPAWGVYLVGSRVNSKIYAISEEAYDDAGEVIRLLIQTGHIDHGSGSTKRCHELRLRARRGQADVSNPKLLMRYRESNRPQWSYPRELSLGSLGDTDFQIRALQLGMYQARQWEFMVSDPVPVSISYGELDVEILG